MSSAVSTDSARTIVRPETSPGIRGGLTSGFHLVDRSKIHEKESPISRIQSLHAWQLTGWERVRCRQTRGWFRQMPAETMLNQLELRVATLTPSVHLKRRNHKRRAVRAVYGLMTRKKRPESCTQTHLRRTPLQRTKHTFTGQRIRTEAWFGVGNGQSAFQQKLACRAALRKFLLILLICLCLRALVGQSSWVQEEYQDQPANKSKAWETCDPYVIQGLNPPQREMIMRRFECHLPEDVRWSKLLQQLCWRFMC